MDCIYNSGDFCYKDRDYITECPYVGNKSECEDAEEDW